MEVYYENRTFDRLANCHSIGRVRHSTNAGADCDSNSNGHRCSADSYSASTNADNCANLDAASNCDTQAHRYGAPNRNVHVDTY